MMRWAEADLAWTCTGMADVINKCNVITTLPLH